MFDRLYRLVFAVVPERVIAIDFRMVAAWSLIVGGLYGWWRIEKRNR